MVERYLGATRPSATGADTHFPSRQAKLQRGRPRSFSNRHDGPSASEPHERQSCPDGRGATTGQATRKPDTPTQPRPPSGPPLDPLWTPSGPPLERCAWVGTPSGARRVVRASPPAEELPRRNVVGCTTVMAPSNMLSRTRCTCTVASPDRLVPPDLDNRREKLLGRTNPVGPVINGPVALADSTLARVAGSGREAPTGG
eukprot:398024-Prorocentrum_minimum.AAC.1